MVISLIIFSLISLILAYFYYRKTVPTLNLSKKIFLIFLRTITYVVLFLLIYSPIYNKLKIDKNREKIIVLNDSSESISLKDMSEQNNLKNKLLTKIKKQDYIINEINFADGINGENNNSLLIKTLNQLKSKNLLKYSKYIILNSDGNFHDSDLSALKKFPIPIISIFRKKESDFSDILIKKIKINKEAFLNENTPLNVEIQSDKFSGKVNVGVTYNSKKIEKNLSLKSNEIKKVAFNLRFNSLGIQNISVKISMKNLKNEKNVYNNSMIKSIIVKNNKNKIVIISNELNWDAAFIAKSISGEKRWKSQFYLFRKGSFYLGQTKKQLQNILEKANLLVIVQDKNINFSQNQVNLISNFVKNGGGLLFQGSYNKKLKDILPISKFYPQKDTDLMIWTENINDFSIYSDLTNNEIPPVDYWNVKPKLGAKILSRTDNYPTIVSSQYLNGKILYLSCLNLWEWQLSESGKSYFNFMNHTIKWLGRKKANLFEAIPQKSGYDINEPIKIKLHAVDENLNPRENIQALITVLNSHNKVVFTNFFIKENDVWQIKIPSLPKDSYHFKVVEKNMGLETKGVFNVIDNKLELKDIDWNKSILQYISDITGGKLLQKITDFDLPPTEIHLEKSIKEIYLYKKWYFFLIFIFTFTLELFIRKRNGLL